MDALKEIVDGFEVDKREENELGRGTYGVVFPAVNTLTHEKIAAKRVQCEKEFLDEELEREAEILMKVPPHDNIVKLHHYVKKDLIKNNRPHVNIWLMIEFCPLGNLRHHVQSRGSVLTMKQKVDVMVQSTRAVHHLHHCTPESITHRDIKLENILVTGDPDKPTIKLTDFGTARVVSKLMGLSVGMNSIRGSFPYMAPELYGLADGQAALYTKSVDIFALAVCFLAILEAGNIIKPIQVDGKHLGLVMRQSMGTGYIVQIYKDNDTRLVRAIKDIITSMLSLSPSDRPSIDNVLDKLTEIQDSLNEHPMLMIKANELIWQRDELDWHDSSVPEDIKHIRDICFCRVSDGILTIGGRSEDEVFGPALAQCYHFSVSSQRWKRLADLPTARLLAAAAVIGDDDAFVFGGFTDGRSELSTCEKLSVRHNRWSTKAAMSKPLGDPLVATTDGKVYIVERRANIDLADDIQFVQYDSTQDTYSNQGRLPEQIVGTGDALLAGTADHLYLMEAGSSYINSVQYNLRTCQWSVIQGPGCVALGAFCGVAKSGKLVWCERSSHKIVEYDRITRKWSINVDCKLPTWYCYNSAFVTFMTD